MNDYITIILLIIILLIWFYYKREKRMDLPHEFIQDYGSESNETFDSYNDDSNIIVFQIDKINYEELSECKVGDHVNLWTPKSGTPKVNIYRFGTVGGSGKIGNVPLKYSHIISSHLREGLPHHSLISDLNNGIIECRLISKQEMDAEREIEIKRAGERISSVLRNKYKRAPIDKFKIRTELIENHNQKIGNILFLQPKSMEFYIQNPEPLCVKFLDKHGNIVAQMTYEKDKILRILKAYYNNYKVSIKIIEIEGPDSDIDLIEAKAIVYYESVK